MDSVSESSAPAATVDQPLTPLRRLGRLVLGAAALQLVYWLSVHPVLFNSPTLPPLYAVGDVQEAVLDDPGPDALAKAHFTASELPWSACCAPGYRALRFNVDIPRLPVDGVALVTNAQVDNLRVYVNGQVVETRGRMSLPRATYDANIKRVLHVPPALFHVGSNRVEYVMVRQSMPYFDVSKPILADHALAWPLFRFREFILTDYELIGVALGVVIAVFSLVLMRRSSERGLPLWMMVLALNWSLLSQFYFWVDPPLSAQSRMLYYFALANLLPVAWLNFSDQWTRRSFGWLAPASLAAYACCMAATTWALDRMAVPDGFERASDLADWFGLAFSAGAILRFAWHAVSSDESRVGEFAVFALCITLLAADLANELLRDYSSGLIIRSVPLLLLAFLFAFLARNIRLFQSMHEINQLLRTRLQAREAELAESYRRESDLVRREAHQAERQRLMRDMHDGVGSQLTSMLFAARRGPVPAEQLAESLQTVIDEIRLLIDSMDTIGDTLAGALQSFQQRAAQRLAAAGVTLDYQPEAVVALPAYGPRASLQVLRILQEAISNALRHANCDRILLRVSGSDDTLFCAQLLVQDNGRGFSAAAKAGRGLGNMESRANSLGAKLEIDRNGPGVALRLLLPRISSENAA